MTATIEKNELVIRVPMGPLRPSSSGKTRLVASERQQLSLQVEGQPLTIALNAYIPAEKE